MFSQLFLHCFSEQDAFTRSVVIIYDMLQSFFRNVKMVRQAFKAEIFLCPAPDYFFIKGDLVGTKTGTALKTLMPCHSYSLYKTDQTGRHRYTRQPWEGTVSVKYSFISPISS